MRLCYRRGGKGTAPEGFDRVYTEVDGSGSILPGNWVAYLPFGLSSLTRISVVEPEIGIFTVSAFGIEAAILTLMIAGVLMWGYKEILN